MILNVNKKEFTYCFSISGIKIEIHSPVSLRIGNGFRNFIVDNGCQEQGVKVYIKQVEDMRILSGKLCGKDILLEYYFDSGKWYCEAPGKYGPVTRATYDEEVNEVLYEISEKFYPHHITSVDKIMQLFPMRQLLHERETFLLHSSQIIIKKKGILFTGNSGVGKTTQAHLWKEYRKARIVCNDRTALRKQKGNWKTFGFPIDGSEPIYEKGTWNAAAIVFLSHSTVNRVCRFEGAEVIKSLMKQMVLDSWNIKMCMETADRLVDLISEIPVYFLECTPDRRAVECLEEQLGKDGVLECQTEKSADI